MRVVRYPNCPCCQPPYGSGAGSGAPFSMLSQFGTVPLNCNDCEGGVAARVFELTVTGVTLRSSTVACPPCAELNGNFFLYYNGASAGPYFTTGCPIWSSLEILDFSGCTPDHGTLQPAWTLVGCCFNGFFYGNWQLWSGDTCIALLSYVQGCPPSGQNLLFNCLGDNQYCYPIEQPPGTPCIDNTDAPQGGCNCDYRCVSATVTGLV
jgi:hypothetical protein